MSVFSPLFKPGVYLVLAALVTPSLASAKPLVVKKGHHNKVVVVKPINKPIKKAPLKRHYYVNHLPKTARFIVLAGISYAIIDNLYYQHSGDKYIYIDNPPVSIRSDLASNKIGKIVERLPAQTTAVSVNGSTFYVKGSLWYAPISGTHRFVIVEPQL